MLVSSRRSRDHAYTDSLRTTQHSNSQETRSETSRIVQIVGLVKAMSETNPIREGQILEGPLFSEPMRVETMRSGGAGVWVAGLVGSHTDRFRSVTLTLQDLQSLGVHDPTFSYTGDGQLLRLGVQAQALGIAYEFDPYFGLSISRVDPLPHQLAAVYDHLLRLARVRFLLADDAGAG